MLLFFLYTSHKVIFFLAQFQGVQYETDGSIRHQRHRGRDSYSATR